MINKTFKTTIKYPPRKMDFLKHFKVTKQVPFLYYSTRGQVDYNFAGEQISHPKITLEFGRFSTVEQPTIDEIWPIENNPNIQRAKDHKLGRLFAANILRSAVAFKSRRAAANILFVPNDEEKKWHDTQLTNFKLTECKVIVDPSLEPNELRATYLDIRYHHDPINDVFTPVFVDGGIQVSPEGFSCIPKKDDVCIDYTRYFARGFM